MTKEGERYLHQLRGISRKASTHNWEEYPENGWHQPKYGMHVYKCKTCGMLVKRTKRNGWMYWDNHIKPYIWVFLYNQEEERMGTCSEEVMRKALG